MAERGISQRRLARLVPCNDGYLSRVARNLQVPSPEMAERLDDLLDAGGHLARMRDPAPLRRAASGDLTPDDEERLLRAAQRPGGADLAVVESLGIVLAAQRRIEDSIGSAPLIPAVVTQLNTIEQMVIEARDPVRRPLLDVAAQWSQFAGWLHASVGATGKALAHLNTTQEWATEIGDQAMVGSVMSWRGYVAEHRGHIGPMIGLSQAGQRMRDTVGRVYDLYQEARARALLGQATEVDRLTAIAAEEAQNQRAEDGRPWEYYYYAPGFFTLEHGTAYRILGRADPDRNADAVELLTKGLNNLPAEMRHSEWAGDFVFQLARAYMQAGEHDHAATLADELAELADRLGSDRIACRAASLR